jgi:hypothetical protein
MKPTVSIDQCFILFLESCNPMQSGGTLYLLERFRLFAQELTIPSHTIDPPFLQTNCVESVLQVAMHAAKSDGFLRVLIAGWKYAPRYVDLLWFYLPTYFFWAHFICVSRTTSNGLRRFQDTNGSNESRQPTSLNSSSACTMSLSTRM